MTAEEQLLTAAAKRLKEKHEFFTLEIGFADLIMLIAQVQLALRHPANRGESARRMRSMVERIVRELEESEPTIGELLRLGFDARHDVAVREEPRSNELVDGGWFPREGTP